MDDSSSDGDGEPSAADDQEVSTAERTVMVASFLLTLGLFLFVGWHAVAGGSGAVPPQTTVTAADQGVYQVTLRNPGSAGFESVTVVVHCGDPPRQLTFEHVPASGNTEGTVVCPPDAGPPSVEVVQWVRP